ncbi:acetylcholinesterase-like [Saccoglossus kowalevskii]
MELKSCLLIASLFVLAATADRPRVDVSTGTLIGTVTEFSNEYVDGTHTVHVYRGVPYAEPPVGELRFAPPKPKTPWEGEYDAKDFIAACIQPWTPTVPIDKIQDEDCLHLNVFVPKTQSGIKSVMMWIHGGGLMSGSGTEMYDATILSALNDVIVVTINYRLGLFGLLSTGDEEVPGNVGFLDQVEALRWIQQNIAAFGGDSSRVTIFGQSAGGGSAHIHTISPLSKGLFKRAIIQSGSASLPGMWQYNTTLSNLIAHGVGKIVGCDENTSKDLVDCIRNVPADQLRNISDPSNGLLANALGMPGVQFAFLPTIDGYFITEDPMDTIFKKKAFNDVDLMIGTVSNEGMMYLFSLFPDAESEGPLTLNKTTYEAMYPHFFFTIQPNEAVLDMTKLLYVDWAHVDEENANYLDALSQMTSDVFFICPINRAVRAGVEAGLNTYVYQMTHVPAMTIWPLKTGTAVHGDELGFVFGYNMLSEKQMVLGGDNTTMFKWTTSEVDAELSLQIMTYWTNFAKTGNPNLSSLSDESNDDDWPMFTIPGLAYRELSPSMVNRYALKARQCVFWDEFVPKLLQYSGESCDQKENSICTSAAALVISSAAVHLFCCTAVALKVILPL